MPNSFFHQPTDKRSVYQHLHRFFFQQLHKKNYDQANVFYWLPTILKTHHEALLLSISVRSRGDDDDVYQRLGSSNSSSFRRYVRSFHFFQMRTEFILTQHVFSVIFSSCCLTAMVGWWGMSEEDALLRQWGREKIPKEEGGPSTTTKSPPPPPHLEEDDNDDTKTTIDAKSRRTIMLDPSQADHGPATVIPDTPNESSELLPPLGPTVVQYPFITKTTRI